jgi:putative transposase
VEKIAPLVDALRDEHGVGPVCHELDIAPSTYYRHQQHRQHPERRSLREQCDDLLKAEIQRVYDENHSVYGIRKVWRQLLRENISVARCTVARLMKAMGLAGVLRGKKVRTTFSRKDAASGDRVNRQFVAERPDQLWVADFTYVSTWQGFAYVAFIIDVFAGLIVGWRVSSSMETTFVLDALEQALWARRPTGTIHHSDKGSQYVSLAWVDWYNNRRLLERLGHIPPAEAERAYYTSIGNKDLAA